MSSQETSPTPEDIAVRIADAGQRANAEAALRRAQAVPQPLPPEINGRKGPEPTRFGDWERKGIVTDF